MEKRDHIERHGPGRRADDFGKCALHDLLQDEIKEHRRIVCSKIGDVRKLSMEAVPRWVFYIAITIFGGVFGGAWIAIQSGQHDIATSIKEVSAVVKNVEHRQIMMADKMEVFEKEIQALDQRQNVLRDSHMKLMQDCK